MTPYALSPSAYEMVLREFERWTFRMPGYRWELRPPMVGGFDTFGLGTLVIFVETRNSYRPDEPTTVVSTHPVPATAPEMIARCPAAFHEWLRRCVHATVTHEADEWLRQDGVMVFDPHRSETRR